MPGIRDQDHDWNTQGHADRIVAVDDEALSLFASLYDDDETDPREARLPAVHSVQILEVLRRLADQPQQLGDLAEDYKSTIMFDETKA